MKASKYIPVLFLFICIFYLISCPDSDEIESNIPIARAGDDDTVQVGMYAILDGSESYFGKNPYHQSLRWKSDENNSHEFPMFVLLKSKVGFVTEGVFNFILTVYNSEGISDSDTVTITVVPRTDGFFKDPCLDVAVRFTLDNPTIPITDEIILSLDTLYYASIMRDKISTLEGLEKCVNLKILALLSQNIYTIDQLSYLTKLEEVALNDNYISDLTPFENLHKMKHLELTNNNISDTKGLENLTELKCLFILSNPIENIAPMQNLNNLTDLYFYGANFTEIISLSGLINLEVLWLTKCSVPEINSLKSLVNLKVLDIRLNEIRDITVLSNFIKCERLYLSNNLIEDITPLSNLPEINFIDLADNKIEDIKPLIDNSGIGKGDLVILSDNPLNYVSINSYIPLLISREVNVLY